MKIKNFFKSFRKHIKSNIHSDKTEHNKAEIKKSPRNFDSDNTLSTIFDGMGPATATAIIKRRIDKHIINEYGIDELTNTGRYYIARVSEANGIINAYLIDKQNGMVRSLYRKYSEK